MFFNLCTQIVIDCIIERYTEWFKIGNVREVLSQKDINNSYLNKLF